MKIYRLIICVLWTLLCSVLLSAEAQKINIPEPVPPPDAVREAFDLDPFYRQWIGVEGMPVVASAKVSPYAVKEAAYLIQQMIGHRQDIFQSLVENRAVFIVVGHTEMITDIPEYSHLRPSYYWDPRVRGLGGTKASAGEENLLNYLGDGYEGFSVLIHEFAHAIDEPGLQTLDPEFNARLVKAYEAAVAEGLWQGTYAGTNKSEYWAEGSNAWFNPKTTSSFDRFGDTREELKQYDPGLAALLAEVYGDRNWRYTPVATRTHQPHLQGFDPQNAPTYQMPSDVSELLHELANNPESTGNGRWINLKPLPLGQLKRLAQQQPLHDQHVPTQIFIGVVGDLRIAVYRVEPDGSEVLIDGYGYDLRPFDTFVGALWLVKDGEGRNLSLYRAEAKTGRVLIRPIGGPKIEGPWLWMVVPTGQEADTKPAVSGKDWLAAASEGSVTEAQIATNGATAGERVQDRVWTLGKLAPTGGDNVGELMNTIGLAKGTIDHHVAYGSIVLRSPRKQKTRMYVGSDDNHKVWLNGELVRERLDWRWSHDYQESFPVTLKQGKNVLLVAIQDGGGVWGGYFGFEKDAVYTVVVSEIPPETAIRADPVEAGPKIEGPWLWMIAPAVQIVGLPNASGKDWLAAASEGAVTETQIATNGAIAGESIKNRVWTLGKLAPTGGDNVQEMVNTTGLATGIVDHHVAYGSIVLKSPREQKTWMYAGSDDNHKVWLNGELVRERLDGHWSHDYQEAFPVTLKQGKNVLLVAIQDIGGVWGGYFGFESGAAYSILLPPTVHIGPAQRPPLYWIAAGVGTFHRLVGESAETFLPRVQNATGLVLEPTSHKMYWTEDTGGDTGAVKRANLDGSNVQLLTTLQSVPTSIAVHAASGKLYWTNSRGRIQQANLEGKRIRNLIQDLKDPGNITSDTTEGKLYWTEGEGRIRRANLNGKGVQNVAKDLVSIGGIAISGNTIYWTETTGENSGKLSRANLKGSNSRTLAELQHAPCCVAVDPVGSHLYWTDIDGNIRRSDLNGQDVEDVASSLASAMALVLGSIGDSPAAPLNSALVFFDAVVPDTTHLLTNYPNPFNPETWIPYQLAKPTDVTVTIYDIHGRVVRHLDLGHQRAGVYQSKSRAAYWDGRNAYGEPVASGLYFYTLTAGDFSATKKMLIRK